VPKLYQRALKELITLAYQARVHQRSFINLQILAQNALSHFPMVYRALQYLRLAAEAAEVRTVVPAVAAEKFGTTHLSHFQAFQVSIFGSVQAELVGPGVDLAALTEHQRQSNGVGQHNSRLIPERVLAAGGQIPVEAVEAVEAVELEQMANKAVVGQEEFAVLLHQQQMDLLHLVQLLQTQSLEVRLTTVAAVAAVLAVALIMLRVTFLGPLVEERAVVVELTTIAL
jgi:hypothetical protein